MLGTKPVSSSFILRIYYLFMINALIWFTESSQELGKNETASHYSQKVLEKCLELAIIFLDLDLEDENGGTEKNRIVTWVSQVPNNSQ